MAKATIKTEQVPVTTYKEEKTILLELTMEEAGAIKSVLGYSVGDDSEPGSTIYTALTAVGIRPCEYDVVQAAHAAKPGSAIPSFKLVKRTC